MAATDDEPPANDLAPTPDTASIPDFGEGWRRAMTADWLAEQQGHAEAADQDEPNAWIRTGRALGTMYPGLQRFMAAGSGATGAALQETGQIAKGAGRLMAGEEANVAPGADRPDEGTSDTIRDTGKWLYGSAGKSLQDAAANFAADPQVSDSLLVRTATIAGGAAPYLTVAALGTAALGPAASIPLTSALAGVSAYGRTYDEAREKGSDPQTARNAATFSALGTAGLMAVPVAGWATRAPPLAQEGFARAAAELAAHGVIFTSVAQAQRFLDNLVAASFFDPNRPLSQGVGQEIPEQFLTGVFLPGMFVAAKHAALKVDVRSPDPDVITHADLERALARAEAESPHAEKIAREIAAIPDAADREYVLDLMREDQGRLSDAELDEVLRIFNEPDDDHTPPIETHADEYGGFTTDFAGKAPEIAASLEAELQRILPEDVSVRVVSGIHHWAGGQMFNHRGVYYPMDRLIMIALEGTKDPMAVGRHEAVHALREAGLYSDGEWSTLVDHAKKIGVDDDIGIAEYRKLYRSYPDLEERLDQERVAALAERWKGGERFGSAIDALLARIYQVIEALRNALAGHGFNTVDSVFNKTFTTGEIGRRGQGGGR